MTITDAKTTKTTCPYCGVGCGILATPDSNGGATITGDPSHPANFGRLCSKGSALGETLVTTPRLLHPMLRGLNGTLERTTWANALDDIASRFQHIISEHGSDAIAFYLSGQLLTEDYYVANKFMKGFVGTANVDTNSRLCMSSSVAGHRRAFGSDTVPGCYEDLDQADLLILVGSNTAWCHPVLFQRMMKNKQERGARIVVIDPRRTETAEESDLFLGLKPGSDTVLFSGLLVHLAETHSIDPSYIAQHTTDFSLALDQARRIAGSATETAIATGLSKADVIRFFELFDSTPRTVTAFSQGVNQSAQGTDKVNAIINCHLATGRIGKPGASPFSLTGQPNAMGGREVGGLANQLAAHMHFSPTEIDRVQRFWQAPRMALREGLKAVDMFEAIEQRKIKALWVMGSNPAVTLPNADRVRGALAKLDLFVVSENVLSNDTIHSGAHVLLPAHAWGEKSGTVTNSERCISRQREFMPIAGEAKPDWWIVSQIAKRMGFGQAFNFATAADIFREHALLSAFENDGSRDFNIGGLSDISNAAFDELAPVTWPIHRNKKTKQRFFSDGQFYFGDGKARFSVPTPPKLHQDISPEYSLRLNTGRIRDQWHTMTRSGLSPRLGQHITEPFVEIHPEDAENFHIKDKKFARVSSAHGHCILRVVVTDRQQRGMLFAPIHWSEETSSDARVGALIAPITDPISGQPESKATPATISPHPFALRGFVLSRIPLSLPAETSWARVAIEGGYGYLFATNNSINVWRSWLQSEQDNADTDITEYRDDACQTYRAAGYRAGALQVCLFVSPDERFIEWDAVKASFEAQTISEQERRYLLSGQDSRGANHSGPIICACFGVGRTTISNAITSARAQSVSDIGKELQAGTNCGSCIPELKRILAQNLLTADTEKAARRDDLIVA
jgi:assimilatory nitrate reductase catalytic subunit